MSRSTPAPLTLDDLITEKDFQQTVIDLAEVMGWEWYHTHNAKHSPAGFPDLVLTRPPRLIFAELKTERGRVSKEQEKWLRLLGECVGAEIYVWRPRHWEQIRRALG